MNESIGKKKFICRVVEGKNQTGELKCPSTFASYFGLMGLDNIGLHLPNRKTWLGRFVNTSERIKGIDSLMQFFDVKPCYLFGLEYIGGTEFEVEIFNDYAVEVNYLGPVKKCLWPERLGNVAAYSVFDISDMEKAKMHASFSYNAMSSSDIHHEFAITNEHLQGTEYTKVMSEEEAAHMGIEPPLEWLELCMQHLKWKVNLKWKDNEVWFDNGWNKFAGALKLVVGDICVLLNTIHEKKFEVTIYQQQKMTQLLKNGGVEGKGVLKWFKIMTWMSVYTGEVEVPYIFAKAYGAGITKNARLVMPDGFISACYFSNTGNLIFGFKELMVKYSVQENWTLFFDYIGNSSFYVTIYNEEGMGIFNDLPQKWSAAKAKLGLEPQVIAISDSDESEDDSLDMETDRASEVACIGQTTAVRQTVNKDALYNFSIDLLKSHVDQNNHGVFLPRYLSGLYRKWNKGTVVVLVMKRKRYELRILKRKKTCRLGVGWNQFTLNNGLEEGQRLTFTYVGNATFNVTKATFT